MSCSGHGRRSEAESASGGRPPGRCSCPGGGMPGRNSGSDPNHPPILVLPPSAATHRHLLANQTLDHLYSRSSHDERLYLVDVAQQVSQVRSQVVQTTHFAGQNLQQVLVHLNTCQHSAHTHVLQGATNKKFDHL